MCLIHYTRIKMLIYQFLLFTKHYPPRTVNIRAQKLYLQIPFHSCLVLQHRAHSQPFDLQSPAIDIWARTHTFIQLLLPPHTFWPAPSEGEPFGRTSGFRRWRWGRCRGRGHRGQVWVSTAAGEATATLICQWRCWQPETSDGSP